MATLSLPRRMTARRSNLLALVGQALGVWRQRRHLAQLDAHLRRDLGLSVRDVATEAQRPVWDVPQSWRV